jgi:hypothetical protein
MFLEMIIAKEAPAKAYAVPTVAPGQFSMVVETPKLRPERVTECVRRPDSISRFHNERDVG